MSTPFIDPHAFTKFICVVYALNILNYAAAGKSYLGNVLYWICALGITICATWLVKR